MTDTAASTTAAPDAAKRNYRATFIIDNRGREDSVDKLVDDIKAEIAAVKGEVGAVDTIGKRDFARVTDAKFTNGVYIQITYAAPAGSATALKERLRLNNAVYRIFIENV
jgi:small subunit ribosomal protein S6